MRLVLMSDTHMRHDLLTVPDGDVVIHAGDATRRGSIVEVAAFGNWFAGLPHKHKIFVAGNHDWLFETDRLLAISLLPDPIKYLQDSETHVDGLKFYGSPWTPRFLDWAFNLDRGPELAEKWDMIPNDTNVLITHGPPYGVRDLTERGVHAGCEDLTRRILGRERVGGMQLHVFGHIHEGAGVSGHFVNASVLDETYSVVNQPTVIDL